MAKYKFLATLWGNKVLSGECTIDEVPQYLKEDVIEYVEEHSNQSENND